MDKRTAIDLLGGTASAAAKAIGIKPQAVSGWPDQLSRRIEDRVWAAKARLDAREPRVHEQSPAA